MRQELNKETLTKLYLQEKRAIRDIAVMSGWSPSAVRYKCIKYGIKLRRNTWNKKINIKKSVLQKLYVKEKRSSTEIADILSCNPATVLQRCREHKIPRRGKRIKGITKKLLQKLYVWEGRTTREIGRLLGCTAGPVLQRCKEFGIPMRNRGTVRIEINNRMLRRLYLKQGKNKEEIAKIFNCSAGLVYKRIMQLGMKKEGR